MTTVGILGGGQLARMLALSADEIGRRAQTLADRLTASGIEANVIDGVSAIGGGSAPGRRLPTRLVSIALPARQLESALRAERPPVIARIEDGRVLIDLRTVSPQQDELMAELIASGAAKLLP